MKVKGRTNCIFFAWKLWKRNPGSYLVIRQSKVGWWWHFLWMSKDMRKIRHFVPFGFKKERELLPPPIFHGKVKIKDD